MVYFSLALIGLTVLKSSVTAFQCTFIRQASALSSECRSSSIDIQITTPIYSPSLELSSCLAIATLHRSVNETLYILAPFSGEPQRSFKKHFYWGDGNVEALRWTRIGSTWHLSEAPPRGVTRASVEKQLVSATPHLKLIGCSRDCAAGGPLFDLCNSTIDCFPNKPISVFSCDTPQAHGQSPRLDPQVSSFSDRAASNNTVTAGPDFKWRDVDVDAVRAQQWQELDALRATYCSKGEAPRDTSHTAQQATNATSAGTLVTAIGTGVAGLAVGLGGSPNVSGAQASTSPGYSQPLKEVPGNDQDDSADDAKDDAEDLLDAEVEVEGIEDNASPDFALFLAY